MKLYEMKDRQKPMIKTLSMMSVNVASSGQKNSFKMVPYEICSKKGQGALNCYNRDHDKYPLTNERALQNKPKTASANLVGHGGDSIDYYIIWYPDSRASNNITEDSRNIRWLKKSESNNIIYATNDSEMPIMQASSSSFMSNEWKFVLNNNLAVFSATNILHVLTFMFLMNLMIKM